MFSISTVSHITADTRHPLVMLTSREGYKYLFGKVPEGTQRVLNENKFKVAKLKSLFLTGTLTTWSDIGGLPGLFLTLSDSSKKGIDVFTNSAKILSYIVASWRTFVFRKGAELKLIDTKEDEIIGDNNLAIRAIKIKSSTDLVEVSETKSKSLFIQMQKLVSLMFPTDTSKVNDPDPDSYKSDPTETDIHTHAKLPEPQELLPSRLQESVCYIIRFLPIRGKFDPVKAKALGLQPGLNYRKLSQGISVENDKGDIITPEQVIEPPKVFPKVLILDIPNSSYLENSLNSDKWFLSDPDMGEEDIGLVYHFLGKDIDFENEKYLKFISKFPENSKHVISHPKLANNTLVFKRSAINILTLKCIFKDNFNLPNIESYEPLPEGSIYKLHHLQQFHINSSGVVSDDSLIQNDTWKSLYDEFIASLNIPGADINEIVKSEPATLDPLPVSLKEQVHIVTLGTGSALPSLHRNVISTLVRIPYRNAAGDIKFNSIMLDGGENTLGTMLRNFGHNFGQQVQQVFKELAMIHLSHLHADHHLGLISVINKWFDVNHEDKSRKLFLVIPWQYETFVTEWYKHEGQLNDSFESNRIVFISCEDFMQDRLPKYEKVHLSEFERLYDSKELNQAVPKEPLAPLNRSAINDLFHTLGISTLQTVRALHCSWAYSISITFDLDDGETFKVSYSGDTRPNPKFVEIGRNSDLLIHESSLDNELIEEAVAKKHSTMIEAINVARYMNCPKLILTHFSTRYSNKTNTAGDNEDLVQLSESLDNYLRQYRVSPNIFSLEYQRHPTKSFDELDICYAYDFMNYRYKDIHLQKAKLGLVYSSFAAEEEDLEKKERDLAKQREKQEVKRSQRLITKSNSIKKRRVSSEEDSM
ncbi:beta-lactamase superfamily domain-containing protein [Scheffersomyces xylosifermentans]|uniref:beta-lactamase superfamily domain-containing protein n=1 Tax=Scheffersomyces xylosifermentans TaxID=1304137 RepID=UPI00315D40F3